MKDKGSTPSLLSVALSALYDSLQEAPLDMSQRDAAAIDCEVEHETPHRTVIFLDIDGVLQRPSSQMRFKHDLEELRRRLADDLDDTSYLDFDKYDLGAICHDWDREAVERLRRLCEDFGAEIVVSSDWRERKSVDMLRAYFRIHDLHRYVTDKTGESEGPPHYRAGEVKSYLDAYPEVERFVIIDDRYRKEFGELFPEHFVYTGDHMEAADAARARRILSSSPA